MLHLTLIFLNRKIFGLWTHISKNHLKASVPFLKSRTQKVDLLGMQPDTHKLITALHHQDGKTLFKTLKRYLMFKLILTISWLFHLSESSWKLWWSIAEILVLNSGPHLQNRPCILIQQCRKFVDLCRKTTRTFQFGYVSSIETSCLQLIVPCHICHVNSKKRISQRKLGTYYNWTQAPVSLVRRHASRSWN